MPAPLVVQGSARLVDRLALRFGLLVCFDRLSRLLSISLAGLPPAPACRPELLINPLLVLSIEGGFSKCRPAFR